MLVIKRSLSELKFDQLMAVYVEGNEENAMDLYPDLTRDEGVKKAEQNFYQYLQNDFFCNEGVVYAIWEENGQYISALRLEPYQDGLLLEALETKPSYRRKGYACKLIEEVKKEISQKLYAHISKTNTASLLIHEKCGFWRIMEQAIYADGTVKPHICTMCL